MWQKLNTEYSPGGLMLRGKETLRQGQVDQAGMSSVDRGASIRDAIATECRIVRCLRGMGRSQRPFFTKVWTQNVVVL